MANADDSDEECTTQEQVEQFVHRMKSHNPHVQQKAAKEFLELLKWSEHERGHDIERFRRQADDYQAVLDAQITELADASEKLELVTDEFDIVEHSIQVLIDDNEFVSMKMVHQKQEKERAMREVQATVDGLEAARHESSRQVRAQQQHSESHSTHLSYTACSPHTPLVHYAHLTCAGGHRRAGDICTARRQRGAASLTRCRRSRGIAPHALPKR
jgi:hypothetical protein